MKRLPIVATAAVAAAGALAAVPAVLGLAGNPSFSQQVPVRPPQHARVVVLQNSASPRAVPARSEDRATRPRSGAVSRHDAREVEPGDDRGRQENGALDGDEADDRHGRGGRERSEDG